METSRADADGCVRWLEWRNFRKRITIRPEEEKRTEEKERKKTKWQKNMGCSANVSIFSE
ncbi:unnamed protein product, partial [Nesidiocoris tenuis]